MGAKRVPAIPSMMRHAANSAPATACQSPPVATTMGTPAAAAACSAARVAEVSCCCGLSSVPSTSLHSWGITWVVLLRRWELARRQTCLHPAASVMCMCCMTHLNHAADLMSCAPHYQLDFAPPGRKLFCLGAQQRRLRADACRPAAAPSVLPAACRLLLHGNKPER